MKRALLVLLAALILPAMGCQSMQYGKGAGGCASGECGCADGECAGASRSSGGLMSRLHGHGATQANNIAGPPTAAVTYPYYTVRGPRVFLLDSPPGIGP